MACPPQEDTTKHLSQVQSTQRACCCGRALAGPQPGHCGDCCRPSWVHIPPACTAHRTQGQQGCVTCCRLGWEWFRRWWVLAKLFHATEADQTRAYSVRESPTAVPPLCPALDHCGAAPVVLSNAGNCGPHPSQQAPHRWLPAPTAGGMQDTAARPRWVRGLHHNVKPAMCCPAAPGVAASWSASWSHMSMHVTLIDPCLRPSCNVLSCCCCCCCTQALPPRTPSQPKPLAMAPKVQLSSTSAGVPQHPMQPPLNLALPRGTS